MEIFKTLKRWLSQFKANRHEKDIQERIAEISNSFQLTTSNGKAYIAHRGIGIKELDPALQVSTAVQLLENMRSDAIQYAIHEENLI